MTDVKNNQDPTGDPNKINDVTKKPWKKPKLNKLNTEHTSGTTPVQPGDGGPMNRS